MTCRSLNIMTMVAALGIASPGLAQPGSPLPCNALCRVYMGSHYTPPGEPVAAEPQETSAARVPDEEAAVPPRRPVQAGLPAARRFAILPPRRPELRSPDDVRDEVTVTSEPALPVIAIPIPAPLSVPLPATLPIAAERNSVSPEMFYPVAVAPVPDAVTRTELSTAKPVAVPAQEFEGVAVAARAVPGLAVSADAVLIRADPYRISAPSAVASAIASVPRPEPRQRSLLE